MHPRVQPSASLQAGAVPKSSWALRGPVCRGTVKCLQSAPHTSLPHHLEIQQSLPGSLYMRLSAGRSSHTEACGIKSHGALCHWIFTPKPTSTR